MGYLLCASANRNTGRKLGCIGIHRAGPIAGVGDRSSSAQTRNHVLPSSASLGHSTSWANLLTIGSTRCPANHTPHTGNERDGIGQDTSRTRVSPIIRDREFQSRRVGSSASLRIPGQTTAREIVDSRSTRRATQDKGRRRTDLASLEIASDQRRFPPWHRRPWRTSRWIISAAQLARSPNARQALSSSSALSIFDQSIGASPSNTRI
ncbi:hypothetical protein OKW46_005801 [Paraburkholderia sp. WSM4179]|nr:hypothetical protein [Paraburkholderia sp. WSM4179]